jgi:DNA-binding transcriptional ArsR family regulator
VKIPLALVRAATPFVMWAASLRRRVLPPQLALLELVTATWPALALRAVIRVGIADRLARGPAAPGELARDLNLHEPSVRRVLRLLSGYDIVHEVRDGSFELTRIGRYAANGARESVADFVRYAGEPWQLGSWERLDETLRSGVPAFEAVHGCGFFEYVSSHPEIGELFDSAMMAVAPLYGVAVANAYDFSHASPVADVGGGSGLMLRAILRAHPDAKGVLFDLPGAISRAPDVLGADSARVRVEAGDFFERAPSGARTYLLSHVLHNWDDERAVKILSNVRKELPSDGRVLIVETVLGGKTNRWSAGNLIDAQMLMLVRGRERTRAEFEALLAEADLRAVRVMRTSAAESILVCAPA